MAWVGRINAPFVGLKGGDDLVGRKGVRCFIRRRGPRALTWKLWRALEADIWEGDFSTCRMPGRVSARRREVLGKVSRRWDAMEDRDDSSVVLDMQSRCMERRNTSHVHRENL